jgi:hypothetical protein
VHDREWRHDSGTGEGWYVFRRGDPWYLDGTELPLNEFLTLARAYLELSGLPGADPAWAQRVAAMARTFRRAVRHDTAHDAYSWTYWLPRGWMHRGWGLDDHVSEHRPVQRANQVLEDAQHAALDVQVATELALAGHLTGTDATRFSRTYLRRMARPGALAHRVDGSAPATRNPLAMQYVPLARWSPQVYSHARSLVVGRVAELPPLGVHLHGLALMSQASQQLRR